MDFAGVILGIFLNPWFIISLIFWLIIFGLVYLLRKKKDAIYVFFPLIAMIKTKKLNSIIKKLARKFPKFWKIFWSIGIFTSFFFMIFAFFFFFMNFISLIVNPQVINAITPLIPGVTIDLSVFTYLIIPILFVMTTHELAHGIAANVDGMDVKSTGIIGAGFFFLIGGGAFVELDEKELYSPKYHKNTRLRIAAAGTHVNAITAGLAFVLLLSFPIFIYPFYGNQVVQIESVLKPDEGGYNYGRLSNDDVIIAVKKRGDSDDKYVELNGDKGITLNAILSNKIETIRCSVYDYLTLKIYVPSKDEFTEKNVELGPRYNEDLKIVGVVIGIITHAYYIPKNEIGKFFTGNWPVLLLRELMWLWIIAFSITLFNVLPLPVFDGDKMIKELINWSIGEKYAQTKKKKDNFLFKKSEKYYHLSEYRVDKIDSIKILLEDRSKLAGSSEILLGEDNYELIDKIGDGFKSTISFNLPEQSKIKENSQFEVLYEYWHDEKKSIKRNLLNIVRIFSLVIVAGNLILSYVKFGNITFWI